MKNATDAGNGDVEAFVNVEASVSIGSKKMMHSMTFVLENSGNATVQMSHCDILKTYGFTRSQIENKGIIEPG